MSTPCTGVSCNYTVFLPVPNLRYSLKVADGSYLSTARCFCMCGVGLSCGGVGVPLSLSLYVWCHWCTTCDEVRLEHAADGLRVSPPSPVLVVPGTDSAAGRQWPRAALGVAVRAVHSAMTSLSAESVARRCPQGRYHFMFSCCGPCGDVLAAEVQVQAVHVKGVYHHEARWQDHLLPLPQWWGLHSCSRLVTERVSPRILGHPNACLLE